MNNSFRTSLRISISFAVAAVALAAVSALSCAAQAPVFATSAEATGLRFNGAWAVGAHQIQSLDFIDWGAAKGDSLTLEGHELTSAPFNAYMAGVKFTPDISSLMNKTNVPADSFSVFIRAAGGSSTILGAAHSALLLGGGAGYRVTPNLTWTTLDAHYVRVGAQNVLEVSSGLLYYFNPQSSKSLAVKRMLARRAAIKAISAAQR